MKRTRPISERWRGPAWPAIAALSLIALLCSDAAAQILPPLPNLPPVALPPAGGVAGDTLGRLDPAGLAERRLERLRDLVRAHPRELELDDHGDPAVRGEILIIDPSPETLAAAGRANLSEVRRGSLEGLDVAFVVVSTPRGASAAAALRRLRRADPDGQFELNHIYGDAAGPPAPPAPTGAAPAPNAAGVRLGLIDTGVTARAVAGAGVIEQQGFTGVASPGAHGTAVASLLAGSGGAAPGASLLVADVFGGSPTGGSAEAVSRAIAWMAQRRVAVVNVSLVGPPNALVRAAVRAFCARGGLLVAAVGNDGPAAPPLYPASYPDVVGVTGVDARRRVLVEAGRGPQVDFAAAGSGVTAATPAGGRAPVRGTSYAAPAVAGRLALLLHEPDPEGARRAVEQLSAGAVDLGARGRDPVYGAGLVGR